MRVPVAVAGGGAYAQATLATGALLPGAWPSMTKYRRNGVPAIVTVDAAACPAVSPAG